MGFLSQKSSDTRCPPTGPLLDFRQTCCHRECVQQSSKRVAKPNINACLLYSTHCTKFHAGDKGRALRKTLVNAGYALTQPTFQYYRHEIVAANPDAGRWA